MISRFWGIWDIPEQWYPSFEVYEIYLDNDILLLRYMRYIWEHTVEKSQTTVKWWRCRFLPWTRTSLFQDIWDPQSNATTYTCKSVPTSPGHGNPAAQMEENETSGIRFSQFTTPLPGCTQGLQWPVGIPHTSPKLPCQSEITLSLLGVSVDSNSCSSNSSSRGGGIAYLGGRKDGRNVTYWLKELVWASWKTLRTEVKVCCGAEATPLLGAR